MLYYSIDLDLNEGNIHSLGSYRLPGHGSSPMASPSIHFRSMGGRCMRDHAPVIPRSKYSMLLAIPSGTFQRELTDIRCIPWHAWWGVQPWCCFRLFWTKTGFFSLRSDSWCGWIGIISCTIIYCMQVYWLYNVIWMIQISDHYE